MLKKLLSPLPNLHWLWLSLTVIVLDQLSKYYAVKYLSLGVPSRETAQLNFTLAHNAGASFSFLSHAGGWQVWFFAVIAIVVSLGILAWLVRLPKGRPTECVALSLIFGGALGNLLDRIRLGYVNDFIDLHWQQWHFAIFNIADAAVTFGVILLMIGLVVNRTKE